MKIYERLANRVIQQPRSTSSMCGPTVKRGKSREEEEEAQLHSPCDAGLRTAALTNNNKFSPSRENKKSEKKCEWKRRIVSSPAGAVRKTWWSSGRRRGAWPSAAVMTYLITGLAPGAHLFQQPLIKPGRAVAHGRVAIMAAADLLSHLLPRRVKEKKQNRPDPTGSEGFWGLQRSR